MNFNLLVNSLIIIVFLFSGCIQEKSKLAGVKEPMIEESQRGDSIQEAPILVSDSSKRQIVVYRKACSEFEVIYDLDWSIQQNQKWFEKYQIEVLQDTLVDACGYKLIKRNASQRIRGIETDVDLYFLMKDFFELED